MPRPPKTEVDVLRQEAKAIELLAAEIEVQPDRIQDYWTVSADLINLVADIDQLAQESGGNSTDEEVLNLRRKVRSLAAALVGLSAHPDG